MWGGFWAQNFNTVSPLGKLRQFKWDKCYVAKKIENFEICSLQWENSANHGKSWQIMAKHGKSWQMMANHGKSWQNMANDGKSWQIMANHGKSQVSHKTDIQKIFTMFGNFEQYLCGVVFGPKISTQCLHWGNCVNLSGISAMWRKKSKILKFVHYSGKIVQIMANHGKAWQIMANHGK